MLLVEDSAGDVRLMREAIRPGGRPKRLSVARDGVEALEFVRLIQSIERFWRGIVKPPGQVG